MWQAFCTVGLFTNKHTRYQCIIIIDLTENHLTTRPSESIAYEINLGQESASGVKRKSLLT